jgi:hypothetical protein
VTRMARDVVVIMMPVVMLTAGCGGPAVHAVSGQVTLDDQPLDEAVIMFVPLEGNSRKTGGRIEAGRYAVPRDVGLAAGRYRVEIVDDPPIDSHARPGRALPPARRRLPVLFATDSPLVVELVPGGNTGEDTGEDTVFDFDLQTSPRKERP